MVSGIPQGSVLGPILFVLYVNDLPDVTNCDTFLFADGTKVLNIISCVEDTTALQQDLLSLQKWSETWLLKFHPDKCKVLTIKQGSGRTTKSERTYNLDNKGTQHKLDNVLHIKDFGVSTDSSLAFDGHFEHVVS